MRTLLIGFALLTASGISTAYAETLLDPHMTIAKGQYEGPRVALTFDACTGKVDDRILSALIANQIPSTIFVTARWLKRNPKAVAEIKAHPELFEIENHGAKHLPAIDVPMTVFGLQAAGSPEALQTEIDGGALAVLTSFDTAPHWYRGATALYTASSERLIAEMNFKLAGYSLSGDGGAGFSEHRTAKTIAAAQDGDVIIAHINQPTKPAGAGVVEGILKLKAAGYLFLTLNEGVSRRDR